MPLRNSKIRKSSINPRSTEWLELTIKKLRVFHACFKYHFSAKEDCVLSGQSCNS